MSDLIDSLKSARSYRGQLLRILGIPGREGVPSEIAFGNEGSLGARVPDILSALSIPPLFLYQGQVLQDVLNGKSIGLFAPVGSGKKTILAASACVFPLITGKTVLVICESELEAELIERSFQGLASRFIRTMGHAQEHISLDITCDVWIVTDKDLKRFLFGSFDKVREWTSMLGLIIVSNITAFSPSRLSHVQGLLSFFDSATQRGVALSFLISGEPVGNPNNVVNELLGRKDGHGISIYTDNGKDKNPYEIVAWLPPYSIEEGSTAQVIKRTDYFEEMGAFFDLFKNNKNLLVWHSYAAIGKDRLQGWVGQYHSSAKITLIEKLSDIHLAKTGLFDGAILMGVPRDPRGLTEALGNILAANSTVGLILPNDPFSHHVVKASSPFDSPPYPEFLVPEARSFVGSAYLFLYAHLSGLTALQKSEMEAVELEGIRRHKAALASGGFFTSEEDSHFVLNRDALDDRLKEWFFDLQTDEELPVRVGSSLRYFDRYLYPCRLFPGAIRYFEGMPYQLVKDTAGYSFVSLMGVAPVQRAPLLEYKTAADTTLESLHGELDVTLSYAEIEITWRGYKEYIAYTLKPEQANVIESGNPEVFKRKSYLIKIAAGACGHEYSHLLRIWLPQFYSNIFDYYEIFHDQSNAYLLGLVPDEREARSLLLSLPAILKKVLSYSGELLLGDCPSKESCPFCLSIYDCPEATDMVDKKATIINVFNTLRLERDVLIKLKYEGLGYADAQRCYEDIARRIFTVFEKKLDLLIAKKVPLVAVKAEMLTKKGCVGVFTGDAVQIVEKLDEAKAVEVIAHEYAHNWGHENIVAFQDYPSDMPSDDKIKNMMNKLISEGFAQWVAFKVMDHFGLESSLADIYLWDFDEYGEGFRVLYWLETQLGFMAVMNFVKNGKVTNSYGQEWGLNAVLEKSGNKARVLQWLINRSPDRE